MNILIKNINTWLLCSLLLAPACQQNSVKVMQAEPVNINLAEQFLNAYNAHNQEQMLGLVHPEISYMYIDKNQIFTETNNKAALAEFLAIFFQDKPKAQSLLLSSNQQGPFIHQVEKAVWLNDAGQPESQCSLSVYEIKQQLIINVWYFSTFECPPA